MEPKNTPTPEPTSSLKFPVHAIYVCLWGRF